MHVHVILGLGVWRRVGDLATDLLVLGLNREATYSTTPFFLAECRRRTFARAYYLDKVFAAVFNRPPRISARHADCKLPLDLSDNELFTSPDKLQDTKQNLTLDGWNTGGQHRIATWCRIRYILAEFREETVEYQFRSIQTADVIKLRYVLFPILFILNVEQNIIGIYQIAAIRRGMLYPISFNTARNAGHLISHSHFAICMQRSTCHISISTFRFTD